MTLPSHLVCLACNCGGSVPLLRQFLQGHGVPNYLEVPILKGDKAKEWARAHSRNYPDLNHYLSVQSAFAIIVGGDSARSLYDWVDINNAKISHVAKADILLKTFLFN